MTASGLPFRRAAAESKPSDWHRLIDGREPLLEPFMKIFLEPGFQMSAPFPIMKFFNSSSDLAKGQDAGKQCVGSGASNQFFTR